ncbi:MAG: 5-oxoprolinase subunit PxpB [Chloroflexales bacterium]|nr:5-oxoprolinase subunit PxpB [Chloroflexales bacterium]
MGEGGLLIEGTPPSPLVNRYALALAERLTALRLYGVEAIVPAISSLLVTFDPLLLPWDALRAHVAQVLAQVDPAPELPARVVEIPVRYGGAHGPDLPEVAATLGLRQEEVVALHCGQVHRVMMVGFAPGFPYVGPLPPALDLPRRATPRIAVPAGSVAIAAGLTGIYPARLPGGWHLIGRTELTLFDPAAEPPTLLIAGDGVRFVPLAGGVTP